MAHELRCWSRQRLNHSFLTPSNTATTLQRSSLWRWKLLLPWDWQVAHYYALMVCTIISNTFPLVGTSQIESYPVDFNSNQETPGSGSQNSRWLYTIRRMVFFTEQCDKQSELKWIGTALFTGTATLFVMTTLGLSTHRSWGHTFDLIFVLSEVENLVITPSSWSDQLSVRFTGARFLHGRWWSIRKLHLRRIMNLDG